MAGKVVVLSGASGYLGRYLGTELARAGVTVRTLGRGPADLRAHLRADLADADSIAALAPALEGATILHAAAVATLAECARAPARAEAVNHLAVAALLRCRPARLVMVSTDLVFDGRAAPYGADAEPAPLSVYGRTKAAGERAALAGGGLVARLPLLVGRSHDGRRGATDMIRTAHAEGRVATLFTNEYRTPLHAADAARGLCELLLAAAPRCGIVHLAGRERISRAELGRRFVALHGLPAACLAFAECADPDRPTDVSLRSEWDGGRSLAEALRDS